MDNLDGRRRTTDGNIHASKRRNAAGNQLQWQVYICGLTVAQVEDTKASVIVATGAQDVEVTTIQAYDGCTTDRRRRMTDVLPADANADSTSWLVTYTITAGNTGTLYDALEASTSIGRIVVSAVKQQ